MFIRSLSHPITIESDHDHKLTMFNHNSCSQIYSRCLKLQLVKTFGNESITIAKFNSRLLHSVLRVNNSVLFIYYVSICVCLCVIVCTYCQVIWQFNITLIVFETNKLIIRVSSTGECRGEGGRNSPPNLPTSPSSKNTPKMKLQ